MSTVLLQHCFDSFRSTQVIDNLHSSDAIATMSAVAGVQLHVKAIRPDVQRGKIAARASHEPFKSRCAAPLPAKSSR